MLYPLPPLLGIVFEPTAWSLQMEKMTLWVDWFWIFKMNFFALRIKIQLLFWSSKWKEIPLNNTQLLKKEDMELV